MIISFAEFVQLCSPGMENTSTSASNFISVHADRLEDCQKQDQNYIARLVETDYHLQEINKVNQSVTISLI
jgi:hypothetical protein